MTFTVKTLVCDCGKVCGSVEECQRLWEALISCIEDTMLGGKSLLVPGLCRFMYIKSSKRDLHQGVKGRVFVLDPDFLRAYHTTMRVPSGTALLVPCLSVNYSKLAALSGLSKDRVRQTLATMTKMIGQTVMHGEPVRLSFGQTGALAIEGRVASFQFGPMPVIPERAERIGHANPARGGPVAREEPFPDAPISGASTSALARAAAQRTARDASPTRLEFARRFAEGVEDGVLNTAMRNVETPPEMEPHLTMSPRWLPRTATGRRCR